jgi:hypothetical protein
VVGATTVCAECGAVVPDIEGPTHAYVPSAPGCWALFGQIQAESMSRPGFARRQGTVVDCYMAQHPGDGSERRARQSPIVHLVALCLLLEHGIDGVGSFGRMGRLLEGRSDFEALRPRSVRGSVTVAHVAGAADADEHTARVDRWARIVWQTWAHEHGRIHALAAAVL